ncbi:sensor histidine kinase [Spirosoma koreense]
METEPTHGFSLTIDKLVSFLFSRRETLLNTWRTVCEADPALSKVGVLSREEFNNLLPIILDILEQRLQGKKEETDPAVAAESHGLHRWQKSMNLPDLVKEISHLGVVLFEEVKLFRSLQPDSNADEILKAQQQILVLINETIRGSITKHDELQRLEAANRVESLQQALQEMEELSRQRAELLRTSSHDLRSGLGIISGAAQVLNTDELGQEERQQFAEMLNRNITNVRGLLTGLIDLSRLEASLESVQMEEVDAAQLLIELVASTQPMAKERGLFLRADGPPTLRVKTDRVKIHRIAQNLLVNALKYTTSTTDKPGIVSVSWSSENDWRWGFSVQDSGPGLPAGLLELFHQQLKPVVEETSVLSPDEGQPIAARPNSQHEIPEGPALASFSPGPSGEGVGLQIVKRLCELVGASLEVESIAGRGTLVRVRLLQHPSA